MTRTPDRAPDRAVLHVSTLICIGRYMGLDFALAVYEALEDEPCNDHGWPEDWASIRAQILQHPPLLRH